MSLSDLTRTVRSKADVCGCGCWVWSGATNSKGYSTVKIKGKQVAVHRYAYEALVAPIPGDMTIDHLCDRHRRCINPSHMEVVTRSENSIRANHRRFHETRDRASCTIDNQGEQK